MIESLYIHLPFCESKCHYCDFVSFPNCSDELKKKYVEVLKKEAVLRNNNLDIKLKTIFLGGGTPTCLSGGLLAHLIVFMRHFFKLQSQVEISIEANPGTVDKEKLSLLKKVGVNRLSFGAQSFDVALLSKLGRIHAPDEINKGFELAREAGFLNINLDLMYGLPGQSLEQWEKTLQKALELNPEHLSIYQLKIEEGTFFGSQLAQGKIDEFEDELALEMYCLAKDFLKQVGYEHYEISNFAKPGFRCIHNQTYWLTKPYLGLGTSAHSYIPPKRIANLGELKMYITSLEQGKLPPFEEESLSSTMAMSEAMFMGLRMIEGVNIADFKARFGLDAFEVFSKPIDKCLSLGLVEFNDQYIKLTEKGLYLGNLVFEEFIDV